MIKTSDDVQNGLLMVPARCFDEMGYPLVWLACRMHGLMQGFTGFYEMVSRCRA